MSKGQRKLDLAQRLTGALSSENDRWAENVVQLRADMELLTGDVLLAASFIRYDGEQGRGHLKEGKTSSSHTSRAYTPLVVGWSWK